MYAAYNGYPQVVKLLLGKKTFSTLLLSFEYCKIRTKLNLSGTHQNSNSPWCGKIRIVKLGLGLILYLIHGWNVSCV